MNFDFHALRGSPQYLNVSLAQIEGADLVRRSFESSNADTAYLFKHALVQDTAYASLLKNDRTRLHHTLGEIIERENPERLDEFAELLTHFFSQAGDDAKISVYAFKAAEAVGRLNADREAVLYYQCALDALRRLPDTDENRRRRIEVIYGYIERSWGATVAEEHFALAAEAETLSHTLKNPDGTSDAARAVARILTMRAALHIARSEYRDASHYLREVLAQARALEDESIQTVPTAQLGTILVLQGHFAEAEPYLRRAKELVGERTDNWEWSWSLGFLGISLAMRGQITPGLDEIQDALARMTASNNKTGITQSFTYRLIVYLAQGALQSLLETSRESVVHAIDSGFILYGTIGLGFQALAASRLGQPQAAAQALTEMDHLAQQLGGQVMMADWFAAARAEIALNAGRASDAAQAAESAALLARAQGGIFAEAWAQRVWGLALAQNASGSDQSEAVESHLAESVRLFELCGARLEVARSHAAWGKFLQRLDHANGRGSQRDAARSHLEQAASEFERANITGELAETRAAIQTI